MSLLLFLVLGSASAQSCAFWCNPYTCGLGACTGCSSCVSLAAGTHCSPWCNAYTTSFTHCAGCAITAEVASGTHCGTYCNPYTCGLAHCEGCPTCEDVECGMYCASWCNPFTCSMGHCAGCSTCENPIPAAPSVSSLPQCVATLPTTRLVTSGLNASNVITAENAVPTGNRLTLFSSNCGRPLTTSVPMAVGSISTSDAFGALNMATRRMLASPPGGLNSADNGLSYFYTDDGTSNVQPQIQQYNPCNYGGVLAYCSASILGYDYDYGPQINDPRTYCFAFQEGQYCDGADTVRMTGWQVRTDASRVAALGNGATGEYSLFGGANNPFTSPQVPATFACSTSHMMPAGLGVSSPAPAGSRLLDLTAPSATCNLCD